MAKLLDAIEDFRKKTQKNIDKFRSAGNPDIQIRYS